MAYAVTNPPVNIWQRIGLGSAAFIYTSADPVATVRGAGYFTNGADLGMKVNDVVFVVDSATPLGTLTVVSAVDADTGAATVV